MSIQSSFSIALKALARNKLQTALTIIGMTIGVATVLTMIAVGSGAETAIEQQVRAAGMNVIVVTAGNYQVKTEQDMGGVVEHQAAFRHDSFDSYRLSSAVWYPDQGAPRVRFVMHPEDDPMEKHDHPTASQRLGDTE